LAHLAAIWREPGLGLAAIMLLGLGPALTQPHSPWSSAALVLATPPLNLFARDGQRTLELLYAPPVLINLALLLLFGQSLLPGRTALLTGFARLARGRVDMAIARYTRQVTWLWTAVFAAMALETVRLALWAPPAIWSLFTNLLNYLLIALVFIAEYAVRVRHLHHVPHPGLVAFLRTRIRTPGHLALHPRPEA
jgi:uncharacterized membrane protein